jgi:hypothetical protein
MAPDRERILDLGRERGPPHPATLEREIDTLEHPVRMHRQRVERSQQTHMHRDRDRHARGVTHAIGVLDGLAQPVQIVRCQARDPERACRTDGARARGEVRIVLQQQHGGATANDFPSPVTPGRGARDLQLIVRHADERALAHRRGANRQRHAARGVDHRHQPHAMAIERLRTPFVRQDPEDALERRAPRREHLVHLQLALHHALQQRVEGRAERMTLATGERWSPCRDLERLGGVQRPASVGHGNVPASSMSTACAKPSCA